MFLYSAQYVTDLGFKQQCEEEWTDKSTARYVVFNLNLSSMPLTLRNGHCVPNVCSQLQFDGIGEYVFEFECDCDEEYDITKCIYE